MLLPSGTFESYKLPITECLRQLATEVTTSVAWGAARSLKNPDPRAHGLEFRGGFATILYICPPC